MSTVWKIVISVMATLAVAGGGTYYYMNQKATSEKDELQSQIDELSSQLEDLQAKATTAASNESSTPAPNSPTTDETSDWKTYTNSTYGFSFKYPSEKYEILSNTYAVQDTSKAGDFYLRMKGDVNADESIDFTTIFPGRYNDSDAYAYDLYSFAKMYWQANKEKEGGETIVGDLANKTVNGKKIYYFTIAGSFNTPWGGSLLKKPSTAMFACKTDGDVVSTTDPKIVIVYSNNSEFDQILSTFKFTN